MVHNSIGIEMAVLPAGSFVMGSAHGEGDERAHLVHISQPFAMAVTPITNAQYERFDPSHRALRGKMGFSQEDDEACVFVSHGEAQAFCQWLSQQEGKPYRLPTEAEWEYACRAGTDTAYAWGDTLPEGFGLEQDDDHRLHPCSLVVGQGQANGFGLQDMHGLVEEWVADWYAPYPEGEAIDPTGSETGDFRVTRGGCVQAAPEYLRSARRMAMPPWVQSPVIGFRVVQGSEQPSCQQRQWAPTPAVHRLLDTPKAADAAFFLRPIPFVVPPKAQEAPFFRHNHVPSLCALDNGDLLAVWFSTNKESGREMVILSSRYLHQRGCWTPATLFFKVPGRNMSCAALLKAPGGRLYHFNGIGVGSSEESLYLAFRYSDDDGETWSPVLPVEKEVTTHKPINQPSFDTDGSILIPCDHYTLEGENAGMGSVLYRGDPHTLRFEQVTSYGRHREGFLQAGGTAGWIAGVHGAVAALGGGRLIAFGRSDCIFKHNTVEGRMPMSLSGDGGRSWTYHPSPFPPIGLCQRHALLKLQEGPLMLCSFTDQAQVHLHGTPMGMDMQDGEGAPIHGWGLFAAVSFDEGKTWPIMKLLSPCHGPETWCVGASMPDVLLDEHHAQPYGYMQAVQTGDGTIHLISSRLHYRFNYLWLVQKKTKGE